MKRSSRPRAAAELSKSVNHQLNAYALAAGVSLLASAQTSEAKVLYSKAHQIIGTNGIYSLDLNHDGIVDFYLNQFDAHGTDGLAVCQHWLKAGSSIIYCSPYSGTNAIETGSNSKGGKKFAAALRYGERIQRGEKFAKKIAYLGMLYTFETATSTRWYGPWLNGGKGVKHRYLGLKFKIKGRFHFGWARLTVTTTKFAFTATLTGYAYETIPGKGIVAGKTKGPDVITVQPASLGHLAAGASAIPAWRSGR